jgi:hypothetical protein
MITGGHGLVWRKRGGSAFMVWCKLSIYGRTSAYKRFILFVSINLVHNQALNRQFSDPALGPVCSLAA